MYCKFFGFIRRPFSLVPDPDIFFQSSIHNTALSYLIYGLKQHEGIVALTGEIGSGKTMLVKKLLKTLDKNVVTAEIMNTNVNSVQLLEMILQDYGINGEGKNKAQLLSKLHDFLIEQFINKKQVVLIIDEAQNLDFEQLEEVRLLSNFETHTSKLIQIVLVGQPQLAIKLNHPRYEQFRQRITVRYHLSPLGKDETYAYIQRRLELAGSNNNKIFDDASMERIFEKSGGIPRMINILCDASLLYGFVEEKKSISADIVNEVIQDLIESTNNLKQEQLNTVIDKENIRSTSDDFTTAIRNLSDRMLLLEERYKMREQDLDAKREEIFDLMKKLHEKEKELLVWETQLRSLHNS